MRDTGWMAPSKVREMVLGLAEAAGLGFLPEHEEEWSAEELASSLRAFLRQITEPRPEVELRADERPVVRWRGDCPPELRAVAEPLLREVLPLLPAWVAHVRVDYGEVETDKHTWETSIDHGARWVIFHVGGSLLEEDPDERLVATVHEVVHVLMAPFETAVEAMVEAWTKEGTPQRAFAEQVLTDAKEAAVEDTARALLRWRDPGVALRAAEDPT